MNSEFISSLDGVSLCSLFLSASALLLLWGTAANAQVAAPATAQADTRFRIWLNQDVNYIISDSERNAFQRLKTNAAKDTFIEQFWRRRDPTPDTVENEFRSEHYRRMIYANDEFTWASAPGWKTDRGMVYVKFGRPDERERHALGEANGPPFERWRYLYIEGVGNPITLDFTDTSRNGEYRITIDPAMKEALTNVPGFGMPASALLEPFADLPNAPIRYKELDAALDSTIKLDELPMQVGVEYVPVTEATSLAKITIRFVIKDLQFQQHDGVSAANVYVHGRIKSMQGRTVTYFEDLVKVEGPTGAVSESANRPYVYRNAQPLLLGRYRLSVAAKDANSGKTTVYTIGLDVPAPGSRPR
jgi:GWxTD domain-containing protein